MDYNTFAQDGLFSESVPDPDPDSPLEQNRAHVADNRDELVKEYGGHRIAVLDQGVVADTELTEESYEEDEEAWVDRIETAFADRLDELYTTDLPAERADTDRP